MPEPAQPSESLGFPPLVPQLPHVLPAALGFLHPLLRLPQEQGWICPVRVLGGESRVDVAE